MPVLLRLRGVQPSPQAQSRRLLRVLLVWFGAVSADSGEGHVLLADDVGLGKTISAGLVASELISRARASKVLFVCPKLLGPQWQDELKTKFDIPAEIACSDRISNGTQAINGG